MLRFGFGLLMQVAAAGAFFTSLLGPADATALPVLNSPYIAMLLIALAGLFTGWWLHGRGEARAWHRGCRDRRRGRRMGLLWWVSGGLHEILVYASRHVDLHADRFVVDSTALFAAGTAWLAHVARRRLAWPLAEWPALALTPVLALLALRVFDAHEAPLSGWARSRGRRRRRRPCCCGASRAARQAPIPRQARRAPSRHPSPQASSRRCIR